MPVVLLDPYSLCDNGMMHSWDRGPVPPPLIPSAQSKGPRRSLRCLRTAIRADLPVRENLSFAVGFAGIRRALGASGVIARRLYRHPTGEYGKGRHYFGRVDE